MVMKRFYLLSRLLLGTIFICLFTTTAFAQSKGHVNDDGVNVRSSASLQSGILFKLNKGQVLDVLGKEGDFFIVSGFGADKAYVHKDYLNLKNAQGTISDSGVNIRKQPSTDSQILGQVTSSQTVNVIGTSGEWYAIEHDGGEAYIHKDFISGDIISLVQAKYVAPAQSAATPAVQTVSLVQSSNKQASPGDSYGVVSSSDGLNLRASGSLNAEIIIALPNGAAFDIIEFAGEWIKGSYDGQVGYLSAEFVTIRSGAKPEKIVVNTSRSDQIIAYAKQFLGTPYQWAGTNLNSGVDCSGFVYSVMRHFGIYLNRSSRDMANNGYRVQKGNLQPCDLVFFDTNGGANNGNISHVGIYIGNGQFIHSSSSSRTWGVTISSLSEAYYIRTYVTAARVLN